MTLRELRNLPLVFVDDLDRPELADNDLHHLTRSLRIKPGSPIAVGDGRGRWRSAVLGAGPEPDGLGRIRSSTDAGPVLTVGFAPVKGDRSELVVQKLTELGVGRIIPVLTERTIVRWDGAKADRNRQRQQRVAREAAMQSRNLVLPDIRPLTPLADVVAEFPAAVLADPESPVPAPSGPNRDLSVVLVGPEGGFGPDEVAGRRLIGLPGNILRTETAAIVAGVLLIWPR